MSSTRTPRKCSETSAQQELFQTEELTPEASNASYRQTWLSSHNATFSRGLESGAWHYALPDGQTTAVRVPYWTLKINHFDLGSFWSTPVAAKSPQRAYTTILRIMHGARAQWSGAYRRLKIMPGKVGPFYNPKFHNFPKSPFSFKHKITPRSKPAPKPDAIDKDGRRLTFGMRVACWNKDEIPSVARRNLTLVAYMPESATPYITDAGAFAHMLPDHQPDMLDWIAKHVTD